MSEAVKKPAPGDTIAHYKIISSLGSGGMGDVYLAEDPSLNRRVAIKVMQNFGPADMEIKQRFILEGKSLAKLTHPNIVSVYGLGEQDGYLYIAMEHVQGNSLFKLARQRRLTFGEMRDIFVDICAGIDHAHSSGIIHRDIKPANILINSSGRAKIIDFGIAKALSGDPHSSESVKTKTGAVIGTLNYIAPEMFRGIDPSPASDIYALGLLFFEMITGRTPFKADSQFATMELIRAGRVDVSERIETIIPKTLWNILYQMIDHDPTKRPPTASDAASQIATINCSEFPNYFNSNLASASIDNIEELYDLLEKENLNPEEWPFILSLAVRLQSEKRTNPNGFRPMRTEEQDEPTRLTETAKIFIDSDVLQEARHQYIIDTESIITLRRSEQLASLTPPPETVPSQPIDHLPEESPTPPSTEQKAKLGAWLTLPAIGLAAVAGLWFYKAKTQLTPQTSASIKSVAPQASQTQPNSVRKLGHAIAPPVTTDAMKINPNSPELSERNLASKNHSVAIVIEPPEDAWPPIAYREPVQDQTVNYRLDLKTDGQNRQFLSHREFVGKEEGLLKFRVTLQQESGGSSKTISGWEWYLPGFPFFPRKTLRSPFYGTIGSLAVGELGRIFPLRKGKEIQFQIDIKETEKAPAILKLSAADNTPAPDTSYRSSCTIYDKIAASSDAPTLVRVSCTFNGSKNEINDNYFIDPETSDIVRSERRLSDPNSGHELTLKLQLVSDKLGR